MQAQQLNSLLSRRSFTAVTGMVLMAEETWGALLVSTFSWGICHSSFILWLSATEYVFDFLDLLCLDLFIVNDSNCTGPALQINVHECFGHHVTRAYSIYACAVLSQNTTHFEKVVTQLFIIICIPPFAFGLILSLCILIKLYRSLSIMVKAKLLHQRNCSLSDQLQDDQLQPLLDDHDSHNINPI